MRKAICFAIIMIASVIGVSVVSAQELNLNNENHFWFEAGESKTLFSWDGEILSVVEILMKEDQPLWAEETTLTENKVVSSRMQPVVNTSCYSAIHGWKNKKEYSENLSLYSVEYKKNCTKYTDVQLGSKEEDGIHLYLYDLEIREKRIILKIHSTTLTNEQVVQKTIYEREYRVTD